MTFATAADLAVYVGHDVDSTRANLLLDLAAAEIRSFTRQTLSQTESTVRLAGNWTACLTLPERPVVDVTAVSLEDETVEDWEWDGRHSIRRVALDAEGDLADLEQLHWGGPDRTVEVTYTHGYDPIPDDIRSRSLVIAARALANPTAVTAETLGSYSVTYRRAAGIVLDNDDRAALRRYRRTWL